MTAVTTAPNAEAEATLALAHRFLEAINTKDGEAFLETVAEDAVYHLHAAPDTIARGREQLAGALGGLVANWPDYDFTTNAIYADATLFTAEWTMTGTLGQPMQVGSRTAVPDGRSISFDGVDICTVADGKVTAKISYIDATAWYEQLTFEGE